MRGSFAGYISAGSQGGFLGFDYGWNTSDPGKVNVSAGSGVIVGGAFSIGWQRDDKSGIFGEIGHEVFGKSTFNFGFGKYLGISIAPDLSKIKINIGLGLALPVSHTVPVEGIDFTFGDDLYDWLNKPKQNTPCNN